MTILNKKKKMHEVLNHDQKREHATKKHIAPKMMIVINIKALQ